MIRKAEKKDIAAITTHNRMMAMETEALELNENVVLSGVSAVFEDDSRGFYLVYEENGQVAGNLMITYEWSDWRNSNIWWFQSVYLRPEFRGRGIFAAMYNEVIRLGKENGVSVMRLYVEQENVNAQKRYEALGMIASHYRMYEAFI